MWQSQRSLAEGKTIFDVVDDLKEGDVILKAANALDLCPARWQSLHVPP
jgi:hypothetical protein